MTEDGRPETALEKSRLECFGFLNKVWRGEFDDDPKLLEKVLAARGVVDIYNGSASTTYDRSMSIERAKDDVKNIRQEANRKAEEERRARRYAESQEQQQREREQRTSNGSDGHYG